MEAQVKIEKPQEPLLRDIKEIEKNINKQIKKRRGSKSFLDILRSVAYGTTLRNAIEKIAKARTGGIIVVANDEVLKLSKGGFNMDVKLTTARAAELCKMDGALIVDRNIKRILYAAALLMPSSLVKTSETGARHQAAERTAKQTGQLVIAVSQRTGTVTLYFGEQKYIVKELQELLTRTRETLEILERNRRTFDDVMSALNFREISGTTKVRDFISVLQRAESIFRIEKKINEFLTELGVEGEFLGIQFKELMKDVEKTFDLVIKDYKGTSSGKIRKLLSELSNEQLLDSLIVMKMLNYNFLDDKISAKGYRFLNKISILNPQEIDLLIKKLGFKKILEANAFDFTVFKQLNEKRVQIAEEIKRVKENLILKIKG